MGHSFRFFLLTTLSLLLLGIAIPSAHAEVCDKVLEEWAPSWLMHAPSWAYLVRELISPFNLALIAVALLSFVRREMRWPALMATVVAALASLLSIQENLFPDAVVRSAQEEGCGGHYWAAAIVAPVMTVLLLASFVSATLRKPKH
jgi:hypothetical protein